MKAGMCLIILMISAGPLSAGSDLDPLKSEYEKTRDDIVEEYAAKVTELGGKYLQSLRNLRQRMIEEGDRKGASAVTGEIEHFQREKAIFEETSETPLLVLDNVQKSFRSRIAAPSAGRVRDAKRAAKPGPGRKQRKAIAPEAGPGWADIVHSAVGAKVTVTSTHAGEPGELPAAALVDGNLFTRWSSDYSQPQEIIVHLDNLMRLNKIRLHWEKASATRYCVYTSPDGKAWKSVFLYMNATEKPVSRIDEIDLHNILASSIRLDLQRCINKQWGFSLYEIEVVAGGGEVDSMIR